MTDKMQCVQGVWLPASEHHFVDMIQNHSKVGKVNVGGRMVGTYQYHKLAKALKEIPPHRRRVAVDVGAQVGLWAMHLAGEFAAVECFEPVPLHRECFAKNVPFDNVRMHPFALGERQAQITITVPANVTGNAHMLEGEARPGESRGENVPAEMRPLDWFAINQVDFVKIDVEGLEKQVCQGAYETLVKFKPYMVVEQKGNDANIFGQERNAALKYLESIGYESVWNYSGDHFLRFRT